MLPDLSGIVRLAFLGGIAILVLLVQLVIGIGYGIYWLWNHIQFT